MARDERTADLNARPDPQRELRLQLDDCVVSIWLPAGMRALAAASNALTDAGFANATTEDGHAGA